MPANNIMQRSVLHGRSLTALKSEDIRCIETDSLQHKHSEHRDCEATKELGP